MKLFFIYNSFATGKGGTERIVTDLATDMTTRGHRVTIAYNGYSEPSYKQHDKVRLKPYKKNQLEQYSGTIRNIDPDVLFVFYASSGLIRLWKHFSTPSVPFGIQECSNPNRVIFTNWNNKTNRKFLPAWERELIAASAARIRLVMPGYELSFPPYIRQQVRAFPNPAPDNTGKALLTPPQGDQKRIIIIGGLKKHKNFSLLIKSFALISNDFPDWEIHNFSLPFNPQIEFHTEVKQLIEATDLRKKVFLHPPTNDIFSEYRRSQIHLIPSHQEGCPTCVLEAMAHGLPSIGLSTCPGTNALIKHEQNGLLVSNDPDNMAQALRRLMSDHDLRARLGEQAFLDARKFQARETYDKWEKLFYEMAEYKNDPNRLLREQIKVDRERALHMARCRRRILYQKQYL